MTGYIVNERGWTPNDCQVILGTDFDTNLDGDTYRDAASIKSISIRELLVHKQGFIKGKVER